ncbi:hypothetical protein CNEO3_370019 [Clostridium neonatale]|nr:hypothetical protein CNEO3_370019 [Clostridium neonatale]
MLDCVNISAQNSNERGCAQKCFLQKQVLEQPLPKNLKAKTSKDKGCTQNYLSNSKCWTNNFGTASV